MVETLVSVFVFREPFGVLCVVGIVLVLAGHRFAEYRIQNRSLRAVIYPFPERRGRYEFPVL